MHAPDRPEAGSGTDFEQVLRLALDTPQIQAALRHPDAEIDAGRLRTQALIAAEAIKAEADVEYRVYLGLRARAEDSAARDSPRPRDADTTRTGRGLLSALAVLTPLLSATASAIFLLLGYGLRLAGTQQPLAAALVGTGWTTAALAALAALVSAAALIATAVRHRFTPDGPPQHVDPSVAAAHQAWCHALLERGLLPFLHRHLPGPARSTAGQSPPRPSAHDPHPEYRSRVGYTSPDFASPDFTGPATPSRN
ncbi:hypothetical protein ACFYQ5_14715 [Streptomyces sp. NPDC005794]|uniref:hypothetical protein n=1 Tax=Streptomyces sp. NPDC005794 TaxID=3364733 RepID=UPI003683FA73